MESSSPSDHLHPIAKPSPADDSQPAGNGGWSSGERLGSILNYVVDGIITIDEEGEVLSFNPAAEKIFGYQAREVIGQNIDLLMPEPDRGRHKEYLRQYRDTDERQKSGIGREVSGRRKDGTVFPLDLAISDFHMAGRRYFTGIVRDITQRKQAETKLREQAEALAEVDRRKDEFLGMLAHELRNPLAPIRNAVEVLHLVGAQDPVLQASAT
jgi:PAS domain S-box-containing protein